MSPLARVLVTLFLGGFGVHKFIDGQIGKGILYLFTGGLFGHTSTEMLRHYQDVDIDALRRITDAM